MGGRELGVDKHQSLRIPPSPHPWASFTSPKLGPTLLSHPLPSRRGKKQELLWDAGGANSRVHQERRKEGVRTPPYNRLSQIVTVIQTSQKQTKQYKLNTNKINTMEDRRTWGNRKGPTPSPHLHHQPQQPEQ